MAAIIEAPVPPLEKRTIPEHVGIAASAGVGIITNTFVGEYVAKRWNLTGWNRAFYLGIIKSIISGFMLFLSTQVKASGLKTFFEFAGYAGLGTILPDIIAAMYPGGITGMAAMLAVRGMAAAPVQKAITKVAPAVTPARIGPIQLTPLPTAPLAAAPPAAPSGAYY